MLGFTRREKVAVLFLLCFFIAGLLLYWYRDNYSPLPETRGIKVEPIAADTLKQSTALVKSVENKLAVELNSAKAEDFERLPGIGRVTAARIIAYRGEIGNFDSISQLLNVKGIGEKIFNRIKPYVFVKNKK